MLDINQNDKVKQLFVPTASTATLGGGFKMANFDVFTGGLTDCADDALTSLADQGARSAYAENLVENSSELVLALSLLPWVLPESLLN
jgi:hypothetical protein